MYTHFYVKFVDTYDQTICIIVTLEINDISSVYNLYDRIYQSVHRDHSQIKYITDIEKFK